MSPRVKVLPRRASVGAVELCPGPDCPYKEGTDCYYDPSDPSCAPYVAPGCPPGYEGYTDETGTYCEPVETSASAGAPAPSSSPPPLEGDGWGCARECKADPHCGNRTIRRTLADGTTDTSFNGLVPNPAKQALKLYMISFATADGDLCDVRIELINPANPTVDRVVIYDDGGLVQTNAVVDTNNGDGWVVIPQGSGQPYELRVVAAGIAATGAVLLVHYGFVSMEGL